LRNSQYLENGNDIKTWIAEDKNRSTVVELHNEFLRLLRDGIEELPEFPNRRISHDTCRMLSLQFALALERPLADEPGLKSLLNKKSHAYLKSGTGISQQERFQHIMVATEPWIDTWKQNYVSPDELTAAKQFGIEFPIRVVVGYSLLGKETNIKRIDSLFDDSAGADEFLAWMGSDMSRALGEMRYGRLQSWPTWLESITQQTTRPDIAARVFERLCNTENTGFGGEHHQLGRMITARVEGTASLEIQKAAKKSIRIAEGRLFDNLESIDSLPKSVGKESRKRAKKAYELRDGKPIAANDPLVADGQGVDWNGNGFISEAEYAWHLQKESWRTTQIPGAINTPNGGFGGGGQF